MGETDLTPAEPAAAQGEPPAPPLEVTLITGMSGSGKSVALHALEDAGYYCVDNLPPELLLDFVALEQKHNAQQVAIAMDVRSATSLPLVPQQLAALRALGVRVRPLFLDASTHTLVQRFSETRRKHPLSGRAAPNLAAGSQAATLAGSVAALMAGAPDMESGVHAHRALVEAIELERDMLADLRELSHVIDTSILRTAQLLSHVKSLISAPASQMTLVFASFGFKRGIPLDADYVFDVRMLANPYYELALRPLSGKDAAVIAYLQQQPEVAQMQAHIQQFLAHWLAALARDHRSYVTVAIGCTGGQHRSVYLAEQLAKAFASQWVTLRRHRDLAD